MGAIQRISATPYLIHQFSIVSPEFLPCNRMSEPGDRDAAAANDNDVSAHDARKAA
jgi:hypothetical protein